MWKAELKNRLLCIPEEGKELSPLSTLGVGGKSAFFVEPSDLKDVSLIFKARSWENFPLVIIGGGSNVVFADGLLDGVVLSSRRLTGFRRNTKNDRVVLEAEAGCLLSRLVSDSAKDGYTGAEFAIGIPGTLGGAVTGNAGVGGYSIGDIIEEVTAVENNGAIQVWKREDFDYSYRYFSLSSPDRFLAACKMSFHLAHSAEIERNIETFRQKRANQPRGVKSAGCTFKNPPGDSAGRLLDSSGCKGLSIGGAIVSDIHANFIVNTGSATGANIFELMQLCRDIVFSRTGICLEPEIKFLGFKIEV